MTHTHLRASRRPAASIARLTLGFAVIAATASCKDDAPTATGSRPPASTVELNANELARGIALALAAPELRTEVRDAMRASLWTDHKLSFGDFTNTPAGARLLEAIAHARGISMDALRREIASLPALDFYMPVRAHRRAWTGDENLVVVAAWEGVGDAAGYKPSGRTISVSRQSANGLPPIFFIQPAQRKGLRVAPQANTKALVIEDADDGVGSEVFVWHSGRGDSTVIDMALPDAEAKLERLRAQIAVEASRGSLLFPSFLEPCDPQAIYCEPPPEPAPPPTRPADTTRIATFLHFMCDHTWCYEAGEFRFDAYLRPAPLVLLDGYGSYYRDGLHHNALYLLNVPLIFRRMVQGTNDYLNVHITEQDRGDFLGFNLDDDCGTVTLGWQSNGVAVRYPNNFPGNNADCHGLIFGRSYAIEASYQWTPKAQY